MVGWVNNESWIGYALGIPCMGLVLERSHPEIVRQQKEHDERTLQALFLQPSSS
jgi:hypothetical protein